jgi:hypothetical protein
VAGVSRSVHDFIPSASIGSRLRKSAIAGTGAGANAFAVTNEPAPSSTHVTAVPPWPANPMALRAFSDIVTTRASGFTARSSSASVGAKRRRPLVPIRPSRP